MEESTFINVSKDMMSFIEKSPTAFHVTVNFMDLLDDAGFVRLNEGTDGILYRVANTM